MDRCSLWHVTRVHVVSPWCRGPWRPPSTRLWHQILAAPQTAGASVARQRAWRYWGREESSSIINYAFSRTIRGTPRLTCHSVRRLVPEIPHRWGIRCLAQVRCVLPASQADGSLPPDLRAAGPSWQFQSTSSTIRRLIQRCKLWCNLQLAFIVYIWVLPKSLKTSGRCQFED